MFGPLALGFCVPDAGSRLTTTFVEHSPPPERLKYEKVNECNWQKRAMTAFEDFTGSFLLIESLLLILSVTTKLSVAGRLSFPIAICTFLFLWLHGASLAVFNILFLDLYTDCSADTYQETYWMEQVFSDLGKKCYAYNSDLMEMDKNMFETMTGWKNGVTSDATISQMKTMFVCNAVGTAFGILAMFIAILIGSKGSGGGAGGGGGGGGGIPPAAPTDISVTVP